MHKRLSVAAVALMVAALIAPLELTPSAAGHGRSVTQKQDYAGSWVGSYTSEDGGSGNLSFAFARDQKGQWGGTLKFTNQDGEQSAVFKALQIADGKMSARIDTPDGAQEVAIEGTFRGNQLEGTYSIVGKGSTEVVERGKWSVTRSASSKTH